MTITRAVINHPRQQVTRRWAQSKEARLSTIGLRVVCGVYRKSHVTLIAVKAR